MRLHSYCKTLQVYEGAGFDPTMKNGTFCLIPKFHVMEPHRIRFFRNFLFRCFIVGALFAGLFILLTLSLSESLMPWAAGLFSVEVDELREMSLQFFIHVRIVLVFFLLTPALALHWMLSGKKG